MPRDHPSGIGSGGNGYPFRIREDTAQLSRMGAENGRTCTLNRKNGCPEGCECDPSEGTAHGFSFRCVRLIPNVMLSENPQVVNLASGLCHTGRRNDPCTHKAARKETRWSRWMSTAPIWSGDAGTARTRRRNGAAAACATAVRKAMPSHSCQPERPPCCWTHGGAGMVDHIWLTYKAKDRPLHPDLLRTLRLDMYWDRAQEPAVSVPLGDFFGVQPGVSAPFENALFSFPFARALKHLHPHAVPHRRTDRTGQHVGHERIPPLLYR